MTRPAVTGHLPAREPTSAIGSDSDLDRVWADAVAGPPDPAGTASSDALEAELAAAFGVRHAVAVTSGTTGLHSAFAGSDIEPGDEVLVPAAAVVMTIAAIVAAGGHPVFVDSLPGELAMDPDDLAVKITTRSRIVTPVHLFGRTSGLTPVLDVARGRRLRVVEDACQAQGSRTSTGRHAGTDGDVGCFSTKDGKLIRSGGEGGYLLTDDTDLAARAASFRNHGLSPAPGTRLGHNFRLPQPLAELARHHLARLTEALTLRRRQHDQLQENLHATPGLTTIPATTADNHYSPLWRIDLPRPREFAEHLARLGVVNSTGTFGLRAAPLQPWCTPLDPAPCPHAADTLDRLLAVTIHAGNSADALHGVATTIDREARAWR